MITPLDIENKRFGKQKIGGYNVNEVDDLLDELTLEYGKLYKENAELKSQSSRNLWTAVPLSAPLNFSLRNLGFAVPKYSRFLLVVSVEEAVLLARIPE